MCSRIRDIPDNARISPLQLHSWVLPWCWIPLGSVPWLQESFLERDAHPTPGCVGKVGCLQSRMDSCQLEERNRASLSWENPLGRALAPPSSTCPGCHHPCALPLGMSILSSWEMSQRGPAALSRGIPGAGTTGNGARQAFPSLESAGSLEDALSTPFSMGRKVCGTTSSPRKTPGKPQN